jgi:hypothetical protein
VEATEGLPSALLLPPFKNPLAPYMEQALWRASPTSGQGKDDSAALG